MMLDQFARELQAQGHTVVVLSKRPRGNPEFPALPYEVHYYKRSRSAVWFLGAARRALTQLHAQHQFDLIHAHMAYPTGYVAMKLKPALNVPIVITSHNGDIGPGRRYRQRWITRTRMAWALTHADAATSVSQTLKENIDALTKNRARAFYIPNGVDLSAAASAQTPENFTHLIPGDYLLALGRLHSYKGLDILLEAYRIRRDQKGSLPLLVIAGDGHEREALEQQARELDLSDHVYFPGAIFGPEKQWLLENCRFFLLPSRIEGMPLTALEAMACGKAIVASDIDGVRDLVRPGETGWLSPSENPQALANTIAAALDQPEEMQRLAQRAKQFSQDYSWTTITQRYVALYNSLL